MASTQGNPADFFQHPAPLGSNLYDRDRAKAIPPEGRQTHEQQLSPVQAPTASAGAQAVPKVSLQC